VNGGAEGWFNALPWIMMGIAFLLGSIPFGLLIARIYQVTDLRSKGSGNIGATNVSRVVGFWPAGALTLLMDFTKGALSVALVEPWLSPTWTHAVLGTELYFDPWVIWWVGFCAVAGHCFCPWLRFKGGKGVATGLGVIAILSPWAALVGVFAFVITFVTRKIGSLASLAGLLIASVTHVVLNPLGAHLWAGLAIVLLILMRHQGNIEALLEHRERTF
jgi:glycerol-3-phosphate acyltransferase PlsY